MRIGYIKLISRELNRWMLCDEEGLEWATGDCVHCTQVAIYRDFIICTIH